MTRRPLLWMAVFAAIHVTAVAEAASDDVRRSDLWLEASVTTAFQLNEHLAPYDLRVEVRDRVVRLGGAVETEIERDLAVAVAEGIEGVEAVESEIRVDPTAGPPARPDGEDGLFRAVRDATITARVKSRLLWNRQTRGLEIGVATDDGVVTLRGAVGSEEERGLALQLAANTGGVERVVDELEVRPGAESDSQLREARRSVNDAWITAKVKATLLYSKGTETWNIDVTSRDRVVTLKGSIPTLDQKREVLRLVRGVVGVEGVRDELEVREPVSL